MSDYPDSAVPTDVTVDADTTGLAKDIHVYDSDDALSVYDHLKDVRGKIDNYLKNLDIGLSEIKAVGTAQTPRTLSELFDQLDDARAKIDDIHDRLWSTNESNAIYKRVPLSVTLNGTSWVTVMTASYHASVCEILAVVPTLANASNVILGIFDQDYVSDGDERWNSGNIPESATTDVGLDRIIVPGNLLRIKADADATETVDLVLYLTGV